MNQKMVVHCNRAAYDVLVDRTTKWGNPFSHVRGKFTRAKYVVATREEAIAAYEQWIVTQPHLMAALPELAGKVLGCWCDPLPCHAWILVCRANDLCRTCLEPYSEPPTVRASLCSNGFHCCRRCVWVDGQVTQPCGHHEE